MVKKSLVPFHSFVENAVVPDQSVRHIHATHASVVVQHSVRNGNSLSLPHTILFHFPLDRLTAEGLVHCGAHGHFTAVHPLYEQELIIVQNYNRQENIEIPHSQHFPNMLLFSLQSFQGVGVLVGNDCMNH